MTRPRWRMRWLITALSLIALMLIVAVALAGQLNHVFGRMILGDEYLNGPRSLD